MLDRLMKGLKYRVPQRFRRLVPRRHFHGCTSQCGNTELTRSAMTLVAGDYTGVGDMIFDWSVKHTTPDQLRIEAVLGQLAQPTSRLLHVGVGNSGLAQRWHDKLEAIVGLTIAEAEARHAAALGLSNYTCHVLSKYDPALSKLAGPFDFIVDNNPSLAACCKSHFLGMWQNYHALLRPGGMVMTDTVGMGWVLPGADLRWELDDKDLAWLALRFDFSVRSAGESATVRLLVKKA